MANDIKYIPMKPGQEPQIFDLINSVFNEFVAQHFLKEGRDEFLKYIHPKALTERSQSNPLNIIATQNQNPIGYIEIRDYNHISLFFVTKKFQHKGIGKELLRRTIYQCLQNDPKLQKITVNASPNSVPAYKKIGFTPQEPEKLKNGIRYTPMELNIKN